MEPHRHRPRAASRLDLQQVVPVLCLCIATACLLWASGWGFGPALRRTDAGAPPGGASGPPPAVLAGGDVPTETGAQAPGSSGHGAELARQELRSGADEAAKTANDGTLARWIRDLRDDDVRFNAIEATRHLLHLQRPDPEPALHRALDSDDAQQRTLASQILLLRDASPTPRLVEAVVGMLRSGRREHPEVQLIDHALDWLDRNIAAATPAVQQRLRSGDDLQRFLAAALIARHRIAADHVLVLRLLTERLVDNRIGGDASLAAHAIYRLGPDVAGPYLRAWRGRADRQAQQAIGLILLDWRDPPSDPDTLRARRSMHDLTGLWHDPVVEYRFGRPSAPRR